MTKFIPNEQNLNSQDGFVPVEEPSYSEFYSEEIRLEQEMDAAADPNLRPCQCGSGEPWVTCGFASQECG